MPQNKTITSPGRISGVVKMLFCKCTFKVWWIAKHLGPAAGGVASLVSQVTRPSDSSLLQSSKGEEILERIYAIKHNTEFRAGIHDGCNTSV